MASPAMLSMDFINIRLDRVNHAITMNGKLTAKMSMEILISKSSLRRIAIPVAPPSKKPFGSRNAFSPILASRMPIAI